MTAQYDACGVCPRGECDRCAGCTAATADPLRPPETDEEPWSAPALLEGAGASTWVGCLMLLGAFIAGFLAGVRI